MSQSPLLPLLLLLFFFLAPLPSSLAFFGRPFYPLPGGAHHNPFGPPPFLRNVSASARRQFFQLVTNGNDTKEAIQSHLAEWAQSNGVQDAYLAATQRCQQRAQQMHGNVSSWLTGDALALFNQLWDVRQNMAISRVEECHQIRQLFNASRATEWLHAVVPIPPPVIPGPPPAGCFPLARGRQLAAALARRHNSMASAHSPEGGNGQHNATTSMMDEEGEGEGKDGEGDKNEGKNDEKAEEDI